MVKKKAALSKGEMVVAGAVWRLKSASLGQIHEEVNASSEVMEYATVQSYIRRLSDKGYVKSKREGRNFIYSPKGNPDKVISQTLDQVVQRMFAGDAMPVFRHLIKDRGVSAEELAELRQLIDEAGSEEQDD